MYLHRQRPLAVALALVMSVVLSACSNASATATVAGATATPAGGVPGATTPNMIKISNFAFDPATMTVKVGDKVTWTNEDSATHTVVSDDGKTFQSGGINTGATYSFTFTAAGTFAYHCSVHPQMTAKIIVTG